MQVRRRACYTQLQDILCKYLYSPEKVVGCMLPMPGYSQHQYGFRSFSENFEVCLFKRKKIQCLIGTLLWNLLKVVTSEIKILNDLLSYVIMVKLLIF